jgi:hypothetical protein
MKSKKSLKTERAWAAGFYDGEGSSKKHKSQYKLKSGKRRIPNEKVCMTVSQVHKDSLIRFQKAVNGIGRINGPYKYGANKKPYFIWSVAGNLADEVFKLLKPFLTKIKIKQFNIVKKEAEFNNSKNRKKGWIYNVKN